MSVFRGIVVLVLGLGIVTFGCDGNPTYRYPKPETQFPLANAVASWSPDGRTIAVAWSGLPTFRNRGIYLIHTADWTTDSFYVVEGPAPAFGSVTWSPTGEWLAFGYNAQIYKIKRNGDSLTQLTNTSRQWFCDWSDSDSLIAYNIQIGDSAGIWLMEPNGDNKRELIAHGFDPCFTLGDSIIFLANIDTAPDDSGHFSVRSIADSAARLVYEWRKGHPYSLYYNPQVSEDGKWIVLSIEENVWQMTMEGKSLVQLTTGGGRYPHWSFDGTKIVYCKPDTNGGSIWIMNADGTGKRQIEGW